VLERLGLLVEEALEAVQAGRVANGDDAVGDLTCRR